MQNLIEEPQTTVIYKFIVKLKHNEGKDTEFLCCDKKFDLAGDVEGVNFELHILHPHRDKVIAKRYFYLKNPTRLYGNRSTDL